MANNNSPGTNHKTGPGGALHLLPAKDPSNQTRNRAPTNQNGIFDGCAPDAPSDPLPPLIFRNRLQPFLQAWQNITTDTWVLSIVQEGYFIAFDTLPKVGVVRKTQPSPALEEEIQSLLHKGAIDPVPRSAYTNSYFSRYFIISKKDGGLRPILDLRRVNRHITAQKFRMITLSQILPFLRRGDWFATIDLKDAYFHITVHPDSRRFLAFIVGDNAYQYRVLPFGLCTAPRVFTKCVAVVAAWLRQRGVVLFPYLDDWLLTAPSKDRLLEDIRLTLSLLKDLGLLINMKKSHLEPCQQVTFIGAHLDSSLARAFLPEDRRTKLHHIIRTCQRTRRVRAHTVQILLGHMASTTSVTPHARLRFRPLQRWFLQSFNPLHESNRKWLSIPRPLLRALDWWLDDDNLLRGMTFIPPQPTMTLTTDASSTGWGAHTGNHTIQGLWTSEERSLHINAQELLAVQKACRAFEPLLLHQTVLVTTDNTTVMYYLNKEGGTRSSVLLDMTIDLCNWCLDRDIQLTAIHLPGEENLLADSLSRSALTCHEWSLHPSAMALLMDRWGTPQIDLFATQTNAKCKMYCSRKATGRNSLGDAFLYNWSSNLLYAFPPFPLLNRVVAKIQWDGADCILVTPWWPRQPWFAPLYRMARQDFLRLPLRPDLLSVDNGMVHHPDLDHLKLTAWRVRP